MDRVNSAGILRSDLLQALQSPAMVRNARVTDTCILCRRNKVNAAGLCEVCYSLLNGAELRLATRWLSGEGP
jgi:hypothetical protein